MDETTKHVAELFAGKFTVQDRLDWNGLALVYQARARDKALALAVLPLNCEKNIEHRRTFEGTLERVLEVVHPVFLPIEAIGIQQGVPFVSYQLSERKTLLSTFADHNEDPRVREEQAIAIARRILVGLVAAHRLGLFHGDLTPTNVLVTPGQDDVRLLGLGFAPLIRYASGDQTGPTGRGSGPDAVRYLAPEILSGARGNALSDVFSVGALMFRIITGGLPSKVQLGDLETQGLKAVVERAMARDPHKRFENAEAMLRALELGSEVAREPDAAMPLWDDVPAKSNEPASNSSKLWWWLLAAVLIGAAAIAVFVGGKSGSTSEDEQANATGVISEVEAQAEATDEAQQDTEFADETQAGSSEGPQASGESGTEDSGEVATENLDGAEEGGESANEADLVDSDLANTGDSGGAETSGAGNDVAAINPDDLMGGELPEYLAETLRRVESGESLDEDEVRALYGWIANHRDDVRGHLTLSRVFMARRWYSAAFERYDYALRADLGATNDPQTLEDLVSIAFEGNDMVTPVFRVMRRHYEKSALEEAVETRLSETTRPVLQQRGAALLRRIQRRL